MFSRKFLKDLAERVIASAAGGALAGMGAAAAGAHGFDGIPWEAMGVGALVAAIVSLLKGLIASRVKSEDSASLVE